MQLSDGIYFDYTVTLRQTGENPCVSHVKRLEQPMTDDAARERIEGQLQRILAAPEFQASAAISVFLEYVVRETLAGRADRLKAYTIAVNAYGRQPDFDPQTDTLVRVHARRLRRALDRYYLTNGVDDPLVIALVPGSYVPQFHASDESAPVKMPSRSSLERHKQPAILCPTVGAARSA